jgi:hypothetical protein
MTCHFAHFEGLLAIRANTGQGLMRVTLKTLLCIECLATVTALDQPLNMFFSEACLLLGRFITID